MAREGQARLFRRARERARVRSLPPLRHRLALDGRAQDFPPAREPLRRPPGARPHARRRGDDRPSRPGSRDGRRPRARRQEVRLRQQDVGLLRRRRHGRGHLARGVQLGGRDEARRPRGDLRLQRHNHRRLHRARYGGQHEEALRELRLEGVRMRRPRFRRDRQGVSPRAEGSGRARPRDRDDGHRQGRPHEVRQGRLPRRPARRGGDRRAQAEPRLRSRKVLLRPRRSVRDVQGARRFDAQALQTLDPPEPGRGRREGA